jgi:hypothetical protein
MARGTNFTKSSRILRPGRGWGQGGEMNQALYAHMNNKRKMKKKKKESSGLCQK